MFDLAKTKALGRSLVDLARLAPDDTEREWALKAREWGMANPAHPVSVELKRRFFSNPEMDARPLTWLLAWSMNGQNRVVLDRMEADEFISTNGGDDPEVLKLAPWPAYLIMIPHDVLQVEIDGHLRSFDVIAVLGDYEAAQRGFIVSGQAHDLAISGRLAFPLPDWSGDMPRMARENESALDRVRDAAQHLIVSTEGEMSDPSRFAPVGGARKTIGKSLNEPNTWRITRVVRVDCREHVKEYLSGERRTARAVRWLTRGHRRWYWHGPGNTLRKRLLIEPYWNPRDVELPVADREHRLKKRKR
jgi:hypothetical protein